MPLTESEKVSFTGAIEKMSDGELVRFATLVYESLQAGEFRSEQLSLLGKQFYAKIPWASLHQGVKPPLLRTALAITRGLPDIFSIEEEPAEATETPAVEIAETKPEVKTEAKAEGEANGKHEAPIEAIVVEEPTKSEGKRAARK